MGTRERIIDAATALFDEDGFTGVGLDQILTRAGISKTTFYKYFDSIEDLHRKSIERHGELWLTGNDLSIEELAGGDASMKLVALTNTVRRWIESTEFRGCYFIRACASFPIPTDPRHRAALRVHQLFEERVVELGREAGVEDPERLGVELNVAICGAIVCEAMGRPGTSTDALRRVCEDIFRRHDLPIPENALAS